MIQRTPQILLDAMLVCIRAGVSIIPIDHTTKQPRADLLPKDNEGKATWTPFQKKIADESTVRRWADSGLQSYAVVGGKISGLSDSDGLVVFDFDAARFYHAWRERISNLADGLLIQKTFQGFHVACRVADPGGNQKLAWRPEPSETAGRKAAIETKAEGGYIVAAPSLHPEGIRYELIFGSWGNVPVIAQDRIEKLFAAARDLDEMPETIQVQERKLAHAIAAYQKKLAQSNGHRDVIGAFNKAHSVESLLEQNGYALAYGNRFKRPGGKSGSVIVQDGRSIHFSQNDPLNDEAVTSGCGVHDAFDLYCQFVHSGDIGAAVKGAAEALGMKLHNSKSARAVTRSPILLCMADVEAKDVAWFWKGRIPMGRITVLVGRPGEGKSFCAIDLASRASTGTPFIDGSPCPKGSVIIIGVEDDPADTTKPRLTAHRADCSKIHLLSTVKRLVEGEEPQEVMFTLADVSSLEEALKKIPDCKLIIVDPIGSFLGGDTDAHRDNEVRSVLAPIAKLAEKYGPAVLVIAHRRKSGGDIADDLALGSRAFTGIARAVWHLSRDRENKNRRLLLPGKNNLAPEGAGLAFTIGGDPPCVNWELAPVELSADDQLAIENGAGDEKPGPEPVKQNAAKDWLMALLASGPVYVGDKANPEPGTLRAVAEAAGQSWGTIRRASEDLGVIKEPCQYTKKYQWRLPREGAQAGCATAPRENNLRNLRNPSNSNGNDEVLEAESVGCAGSNNLSNPPDSVGRFNPDDADYERAERGAMQAAEGVQP